MSTYGNNTLISEDTPQLPQQRNEHLKQMAKEHLNSRALFVMESHASSKNSVSWMDEGSWNVVKRNISHEKAILIAYLLAIRRSRIHPNIL